MKEAIYLPSLAKKPKGTQSIEFEEFLVELETLTPVRGCLRATHKGNYLEVEGRAETIITLICDRCLKQYNYRLAIATSELIWLTGSTSAKESAPLEVEGSLEDLVESLPRDGYFEPMKWVYEQLCLEIPPRKLCDTDCEGIEVSNRSLATSLIDSRWAALESLKKQLQ